MLGEDKKDRGSSTSRFLCLIKLLAERLETENKIWVARRRAAQDNSSEWLAFMLDLDSGGKYRSTIPKRGGSYFLTAKGYKVQAAHNDVAVTKFPSPGFFFIMKGPELEMLYVCKRSRYYVLFFMKDMKLLASPES